MSDRALSGKERYRARFLAELDGRIEAILTSAATLREAGLPTIPNDDSAQATALVNAVDQLYRHAHSIRGAAGTLGIEPAREAADLLAEIALHLNEEGILGDTFVWDLTSRAADGLAVFGAACRGGHDPEATALSEALPLLRADYERRFAPPEDAADDFAEVARVLRLSEEEIAAFGFPTAHRPSQPVLARQVGEGATSRDTMDGHHNVASADDHARAATTPRTASGTQDLDPAIVQVDAPPDARVCADAPVVVEQADDEPVPATRTEPDAAVSPGMLRVATIFCESGLRLLAPVPAALAALAADRWDVAAMRTVRRVFHTIKGDGRQIGAKGLAAVSEAAEDVFDAIFDARQRDPQTPYGLLADALPLLHEAYEFLAHEFEDPASVISDGVSDTSALRQALLDVAHLVGSPASLPPTPALSPAEERRQRLLPAFLAESRRLIDTLHRHLDTLRSEPDGIAALLGATRALHTLKGNAASMHVEVMASLANGGETLLEAVAASADPVSAAQLDLLSDLDGALRHVVDALDHGEPCEGTAFAALVAALDRAGASSVAAEKSDVDEPAAQPARPATTPTIGAGEVRIAPRPVTPNLPQAQAPTRHPAPMPNASRSLKPAPRAPRAEATRRSLTENITSVDLATVEHAVDLFGRSVTTRTMVTQGVKDLQRPVEESMRNTQRLRRIVDKLAAEFEIVRRERRAAQGDDWDALELETFDSYAQIILEFGEIIADQEEITGSLGNGVRRTALVSQNDLEATELLQKTLLGFRLVRLSTIEPRLDQVVTATARAVGKVVDWRLEGGAVAVDKSILDAVQEPLLHLLRNAIDHGLESAEERAARGKKETGSVTVEASYGANSVIIRVADDGGGIDPDRVAATAVRRGVLTADQAAALDAGAKMDLIWQPGFSTAATVTDISGRGVGLDIVRSAVERVRGAVTVESAQGKGTTFVLTLPLSLSVVRTLVLRDGEATVAVPITQVEGVHLISRDAITPLVDRTVAMVEGRAVTLLDQGLARPVPLAERLGGHSVVVLEVRVSADRTAGCVIDEVLGEEDTLVKALPRYLRHRSTFVGCSVAGNGRPYAIVDLHQLVAQNDESRVTVRTPAAATRLPAVAVERPLVLIVDDSLFMRRSLTDIYQNGGFRVETAEDGEEALATIAHSGLPDLISLDMEMPRLNGLEMLSVLRQLPGGDQVPVFMVTTRGQERHRREALKAGVSRYFTKPFDGAEMLAAAWAACGAAAAGNIA
jgi:chemosensory pili system protein ChpA (sensor histidine kinase/response regulator)